MNMESIPMHSMQNHGLYDTQSHPVVTHLETVTTEGHCALMQKIAENIILDSHPKTQLYKNKYNHFLVDGNVKLV